MHVTREPAARNALATTEPINPPAPVMRTWVPSRWSEISIPAARRRIASGNPGSVLESEVICTWWAKPLWDTTLVDIHLGNNLVTRLALSSSHAIIYKRARMFSQTSSHFTVVLCGYAILCGVQLMGQWPKANDTPPMLCITKPAIHRNGLTMQRREASVQDLQAPSSKLPVGGSSRIKLTQWWSCYRRDEHLSVTVTVPSI